MPPRKTRAGSSQPVQAQKSKTAGKKRKASDATDASDRPSSSQSNVGGSLAASKRPKRGRPAASQPEPEVIIEDDEIMTEAGDDDAPTCDYPNEVSESAKQLFTEESIEVAHPRTKHVHYDLGGDSTNEREEVPTATNITPHPRKTMIVKRRFTLSPSVGAVKRVKTTASRSSLPAGVGHDPDAMQVMQELQFKTLREVLDERVRRRLRRSGLSAEMNEIEAHNKRDSRTQKELEELRLEMADRESHINELVLELETQRQFGIDVSEETEAEYETRRELEAQLAMLRAQVAEHNAAHGLDDCDVDDEMLVLDGHNEVTYPELPVPNLPAVNIMTNGKGKEYSQESSASSRLSMGSATLASLEKERRQFEDAIVALSREAQDAKSQLQILMIELQALGFGGEGVDSVSILQSIRTSFDSIREALETTVPGSLPDDASTEDLIEILIANAKEFASRLRALELQDHEKSAVIVQLTAQSHGLIDHLAEAEIRRKQLEEQWNKLDKAGEQKERQIEELEEELDAANTECDTLRQQLKDSQIEAQSLGQDHAEMIKNIEKLQLSLENYRTEETKLIQLISKMEVEHRELITKMNKEREETVQELENRVDTEIQLRAEAEQLGDERQSQITTLSVQIETTATERDALFVELEQLKADFDQESKDREAAEVDLEQKEADIKGLEDRVGRLEDDLETLTLELEQLRRLNETERRQREAAEQDLDDRNADIEKLNREGLDMGQQANELRQKMFEVQQHNAQKVKELEELASEREEQFQADMADEVGRREAAEELAQQRAATILDLEIRIEEVELQMKEALVQRDALITQLEDEVVQKDGQIEGLKMDLRAAENDLEREQTQHQDRVDDLEGSLAALQETIEQLERGIQNLQQESINTVNLHDSEMEDRNTEIAKLHAQIADRKSEIVRLEDEKAGLERRVEQEAVQMLEMQNESQAEIEALKQQLTNKQAKIVVVEEKAVEADKQWQAVLAARDAEIEDLKEEVATYTETITTMTTEGGDLKQRFLEYIRHTSEAISKMSDGINAAKVVADQEAEMAKTEGDALIDELMSLNVPQQSTVQKVTKTMTVGSSAKKGRGRKKRTVESLGMVDDSGIMLAGDGEEEPMLA